jgi:hypothetical protein
MSVEVFMVHVFRRAPHVNVFIGDVYNEYNEWCRKRQEKQLFYDMTLFCHALEECGYKVIINEHEIKCVEGIDYENEDWRNDGPEEIVITIKYPKSMPKSSVIVNINQ